MNATLDEDVRPAVVVLEMNVFRYFGHHNRLIFQSSADFQ